MTISACVCIGDLDKIVDVFHPDDASTPDGQGGFLNTADVDKLTAIWARIITKPKEEVFENGQVKGVTLFEITICWTPEADALDLVKHRVRFPSGAAGSGREFEILSATDINEQEEFILLKCAELPANG